MAEGTEKQEHERQFLRSLSIKIGEQSYRHESLKIFRRRQSKHLSVRRSEFRQKDSEQRLEWLGNSTRADLYKTLKKYHFSREKRSIVFFLFKSSSVRKTQESPPF